MPHHEERFTTPDGLSLYRQCWLPDGAGTSRWWSWSTASSNTAAATPGWRKASTGAGYTVYAMDLRGHGRSDGPRCFVRRFDQYLDDLDLFLDRVHGREPGKPLFLFGHSMGGLIAAKWAITRRVRQANSAA